MGVNKAKAVGGQRASTAGWDLNASRAGWDLNGEHLATGGVLVAGGGGAAAPVGAGGAAAPGLGPVPAPGVRFVRDLWARCRAHLSYLLVLVAGLCSVVVLEFGHPAAYNAPTVRATAETVMVLFALAGAWLLRSQFAHSRQLRDLLLVGGLLTLALIHFYSYALPALLNLHGRGQFATIPLIGELLVAATFAAAAFTPPDRVVAGRRPLGITVALSLLAVAVAELGGMALRGQLIADVTHPMEGIGSAWRHPLALVLVLGATALFAYAAIEFVRRERVERSGVASRLAVASVVLAGAQLSHLGQLPVAHDWIATRPGLRLLALALILVAAVRQERRARAMVAAAAATAERRRVARDLHDGLAQDLAFIAAHGERIGEELGAEHPVAIAARRALAVSRRTIADLSDPPGATAPEALETIAHELRNRFDIAIAVDAQLDGELAPHAREHVTRIAREAIANAARHGRAKNVIVSLKRTDLGVALRVRDDGCGINSAGGVAAAEGFGMRSMRERAAALGGYLTVRQPGNSGTELEVVLP